MEIKSNGNPEVNIKVLLKCNFELSEEKIRQYEKEKEDTYRELRERYDAERKMNKIKKYRDISIIDKKFYESTFKNSENSKLIGALKKYCDNFIETGTAPTGLFIHGGVGTGKTYAASCLANELLANGKGVLFMNFALYLNKLRASYNKDTEECNVEQEVLKYVKICDLLIIDDLGVENIKDFAVEKLFNLIDTRYRTDKPLIITSNLNIEEIQKKFGDRIADRIKGSTYDFLVKGESRRKIDKKDFIDWLMA